MRKIMIILLMFILTCGIIFLAFSDNIFNKNNDKEINDNKEPEVEKIYTEDYSEYSCYNTNNNTDLEKKDGYVLKSYYEFSFDKNGLIYGQKIDEFIFDTLDKYNEFLYENYNPTIEPIKNDENINLLKKTFTLGMTIPSSSNDINLYLENVKSFGYECNKIR